MVTHIIDERFVGVRQQPELVFGRFLRRLIEGGHLGADTEGYVGVDDVMTVQKARSLVT
jgi:hypothetical protein